MQFLIYNKSSGQPLRIVEASLISDVTFDLDSSQGAIPCSENLADIYVDVSETPRVVEKKKLSSSPSSSTVKSGKTVVWKNLPEKALVLVDDRVVGRIEKDGVLRVTPSVKGEFVVEVRGGLEYRPERWRINAT